MTHTTRDRLPTMQDLVPCIESEEADLLVDIQTRLGATGICDAYAVCRDWRSVRVILSLRNREMLSLVEGRVTLTELGREWAEAFSRFRP